MLINRKNVFKSRLAQQLPRVESTSISSQPGGDCFCNLTYRLLHVAVALVAATLLMIVMMIVVMVLRAVVLSPSLDATQFNRLLAKYFQCFVLRFYLVQLRKHIHKKIKYYI